jgi:hypothetical protein
MKIRIFAALGIGLMGSGCGPATVWDRPGTTQAEFNMDRAQCQLLAEGANPDPGVQTIETGKLGRDIALNAAAGFAHGLAQGAAVRHTFSLCMEAKGYLTVAPGSAPAAIAPLPETASGEGGGGSDTPIVGGRSARLSAVPFAVDAPPPTPAAVAASAPAVAPPPAPMLMTPCGEDRPCSARSINVTTFSY